MYFLQVMRKDLDQHRPDLEELQTAAHALSAELRDPRQEEAASAARDRFQRLEAALNAALAQVEADTVEHAEFENRVRAAQEWVAEANTRLRAASAVPGEEKEAAKAKLRALEQLLGESQVRSEEKKPLFPHELTTSSRFHTGGGSGGCERRRASWRSPLGADVPRGPRHDPWGASEAALGLGGAL